MWYHQELAHYQNVDKAALMLFLPYPGGMTASAFDEAARTHKLTGSALDWELKLLEACRLLAQSTPPHDPKGVQRYARRIAMDADGPAVNALDRLDPLTQGEHARTIREERARTTLRRARGLPNLRQIARAKKPFPGGTPQHERPPKVGPITR